jgi:O-antigen/teichoic acid export membrane protein
MEDLKGRAVRGGLARLCGQAGTLVLRVGFMVIMARLLNPEDFGLVAMVTVVTGVFEIFTTAGLSLATIQRVTVSHEQISGLFWVNILVGAVLCMVCLATAPLLVAFYHEPRLFWLTVAIGAGFLFAAAGVQHSALLQRQLRYIDLTVIEFASLLASYAIGIGMALGGLGYWALAGSAIAQPAITSGLTWWAAAWMPGMPTRGVDIHSMLRFGGTIVLNNLVIYIAYNFDKLLLGRVWGADVLGLYGRAYQLINVPMSGLHSAVGGVAFSALSRLQEDPVRLRNYFLKGFSLVNAMTVPIAVFGGLFADEIVLVVLGPKWTESAAIFRLLMPTILVFGLINPTGWLLQSIGLHGRSLQIAFVIAPLVIVACLIGSPYGPQGVALAFSTAMTLWLIPHLVWCSYNTVVSAFDLLAMVYRPVLASAVAAAIAFGFEHYFGSELAPLLRLLLGGGVMVITYMLMLLFVLGQKEFYLDLIKGLRSSTVQ